MAALEAAIHPARVRKVNVVGMERVGLDEDGIGAVRSAFRRIFRSGEPRQRVLAELEAEESHPLVTVLLLALRETEVGHKGRFRETLRDEFQRQGELLLVGEVSTP